MFTPRNVLLFLAVLGLLLATGGVASFHVGSMHFHVMPMSLLCYVLSYLAAKFHKG